MRNLHPQIDMEQNTRHQGELSYPDRPCPWKGAMKLVYEEDRVSFKTCPSRLQPLGLAVSVTPDLLRRLLMSESGFHHYMCHEPAMWQL